MINSVVPMAKKKSHVQKVDEVGNIFMTYNYDLFTDLNGNREINHLHLKRLMKSMEEDYLICPIIVNERYEIIDGQHRFNACKSLEYPVYFIIAKGYGMKQVHRLNTNLKNWNAKDFALGYADMGIESYQEYLRFKDHYGFNHRDTVQMLTLSKKNAEDDFKNGEFKIINIDQSHKWAKMVYQVAEYYAGYKRSSFVAALMTLFKNEQYSHDTFIKKLSKKPGLLYDCARTSDYIDLIEEIYNYHNRNKVSLKYS